jgi:hypothetical protein
MALEVSECWLGHHLGRLLRGHHPLTLCDSYALTPVTPDASFLTHEWPEVAERRSTRDPTERPLSNA